MQPIEKFFLRGEIQTLSHPPWTNAPVFLIKTYTFPLKELKEEPGEAEELAGAIEGLSERMAFYKSMDSF